MTGPLPYLGSSADWSSRRVNDHAHVVLAPNPGPMTLDGTNTWILASPGSAEVVLVDPGPDDAEHLGAVVDELERSEARVALIVLTHGHADHSAGVRRFAEALDAPVRAFDPAHRLGSEGLVDGDVVRVGGLSLEVVHTPGHSSDSVSMIDADGAALLTGDTILGRGTTVVAYPDGQLADYLESLRRLADLVEAKGLRTVLTGHGPTLDDASNAIAGYLDHRQQRLEEVAAAVAALQSRAEAEADAAHLHPHRLTDAELTEQIVPIVYADVPRAVWPAAALSVRAQLAYLRDR